MWRRVREYAVPPSMIETATVRRAAGDWAGACAAARVDVDLRPSAVRDRYGTELTTLLRADLRRLAPDLLRWHLPRMAPDGLLRPGLTVALARYPGPVLLVARTPPARAAAGQRVSLALWDPSDVDGRPDRRFRLDLHRHLWDATRSGELLGRHGTGDDPPWALSRWAAEAETLLRDAGRPHGPFAVRLAARETAVLELVAPDENHVPVFRRVADPPPPQEIAALPLLPEAAARTLPDLELLRAGLITPAALHPLVAGALAGHGSGPPRQPPPASDPHRVECRGEIHRIALRDGVLTAVDHDPAQLRREHLLIALGGPPLPCLRAIDAVHRDPEALPAVRERLRHGDVTGALAVVEGLLGPRAILRDGPLRDELTAAADGRVEHGVFRAGLPTVPGAPVREPGPLSRRTFPAERRRRVNRARPRTGQFR
ncbi:hypothetical protein Afil01_47640 [Actinorhabdospora filicis]|uniref:Uncharacterized protein n=2 Tax=Actinorhabdospora filicis TaxID=1785913 RepID=A0A9W6W539_9ACTN|nr:hypothetical protein Afil01_47640 [Actinorhabdospora filicis]